MKSFIKIIFGSILFFSSIYITSACYPAWDGDWAVTSNCTYPNGYKVFGDIVVGPYTISLGANTNLGIDLSTQKITFTTGRINLAPTAKIDNSVSVRYFYPVVYTPSTGITACPAGMHAFNRTPGSPPVYNATTFNNSNAYLVGTSTLSTPSSGTFYCGVKGN